MPAAERAPPVRAADAEDGNGKGTEELARNLVGEKTEELRAACKRAAQKTRETIAAAMAEA